MAKKLQVVSNTWAIRFSFQSLVALLVAVLVIGAIYLTGEGEQLLEEEDDHEVTKQESGKNESSSSRCEFFSGKWVFDNNSYPLYKEQDCTFMSDQLACHKFGRKDLSYQNWRWQPHHCDLPRFNATALLERLRNKRLVFVGDSLNRGQWVSMFLVNAMKEYNATVEFYWAPLLVDSNSDDPVKHRLPDRIVRAQAIEKHAKGEEWGRSVDQNCYNETDPILKEGYWGSGSDPDMMHIVEDAD
ncbi:hypothetical protein HYC85_006554 [Camellia sinensis]|uniref:Trichome birefringence-like N-terminal domain-containing protein n=1 Tax=Camellia sinensis TaxID=4442 RepID=A0A7J7HNX8_CAMSI|nr:hypothetical protein HYC85_006554 [Camellia sinensis]